MDYFHGLLPHHVAYGSRTTRLRAVIGVISVLSVLLLASPVPFTYLSRQLCSAEFSFRGAPVCSIQAAQKEVRAAGGNRLASVLPRVTSTMTSADSLRQVLLRSSHSVRKASQGKGTIFLVIYPPHLHREFRIAWGFSLCCNLTHSHMPDAVPVRRTNGLPRASFRFHLTMDTLAFGYALGAIPCARDFHP